MYSEYYPAKSVTQDRVYNENSEGMPFWVASFAYRSVADRAIDDLNGKDKCAISCLTQGERHAKLDFQGKW